jgi:hypothetical protein
MSAAVDRLLERDVDEVARTGRSAPVVKPASIVSRARG